MAVINSPQIGIARGKLGDAVYYRSKGNTNARGYNPNTTNRRTVSQQQQRSMFSSAVKFFARGTQNLFVFAFEDKRTQESDYNAFMRYNAKRGIFFGPEQNENPAYPALGDWIMTHGSLPRIDYLRGDEGFEINLLPASGVGDILTVGQLSALLITAPEWVPGDIFTIVSIGSDSLVGSPASPVRVGSSEPFWVIKQFIVDTTDGTQLDTLGLTFMVDGMRQYLKYSAEYPAGIIGIEGFAAIHSRNVNGQLRVSDSTMIYGSSGNTAISYGKGDTWKDIVLAAWGSEQLSVLQGGVAQRSSQAFNPSVIYSLGLPADPSTMDSTTVVILAQVTRQQVFDHLKFITSDGVPLTPQNGTDNVISWYLGADIIVSGLPNIVGNDTFMTLSTDDGASYDFEIAAITWE